MPHSRYEAVSQPGQLGRPRGGEGGGGEGVGGAALLGPERGADLVRHEA